MGACDNRPSHIPWTISKSNVLLQTTVFRDTSDGPLLKEVFKKGRGILGGKRKKVHTKTYVNLGLCNIRSDKFSGYSFIRSYSFTQIMKVSFIFVYYVILV